MTGTPEDVPPLARVAMPDVEQHGYRVYPLVDHIADKLAAIMDNYGASRRPSTRYKDLVDLVAIVTVATVEAGAQERALRSEAERRGRELPLRFGVPDRRMWETGYESEARRSLLPVAHGLDEALQVVRGFINPVLDGTARGTWDPRRGDWEG